MPWAIRLFLGYAFVILAGIGLSLRFVVDQAIAAPVSPLGIVVMVLLAYTIFTVTLVLQRKSASRALALMRGRDYSLPQDIQDIAPDILRHRLVLSYDALADDIPADEIVARVLSAVPPPTVAPRQSSTTAPISAGAPGSAGGWPAR